MSAYIPIRRNGRLLFRFDPERMLIELKKGKELHTVDLAAEVTAKQPSGRFCLHKKPLKWRGHAAVSLSGGRF